MVAVMSSPQADEMCYRNNLSFVEMLQPFCKLSNDAHFRDTTGTSVSVKGLRLNICDVNWRPPQTVLARKMLNEAVSNGFCDKQKVINIGGTLDIEVPFNEPWFENWRETFLTVQFPSDHEFTRHFLSCLIVLATSDPNILDTANQLTKKVQMLQTVTPQKLPKWFSNEVLNTYVLLHDGSLSDISTAQQSFELLKSTFGENKCFLVQINSVSGNPTECPDPWIRYIKRQPKSEPQSDQGSTPKTPQDMSGVTSMPAVQMSILEASQAEAESFVHPLSPVQEQATEAIHSKYSTSSESINSQHLNPNVWASEIDVDAPHGMFLTSTDVENLRHFVQDYTVRALIPFVEKLVGNLNDMITNKKGVSKSLLSATKRWFVTNKPGAGTSMQNAVIYTAESAELQTRKLGDLYFMFGHYNLAFQAYHQAKRDFNADSAWQYYAGALEMAALAAFMMGTANRKTYDYMEDAIVCYLTVCKLPQFATRATLLSIECLKPVKLYGEAAKQLIRMTSEDSDLRSALLLEQAAYCFLLSQPSMHRKYAFHIVLSGNRYSRAGQRKHAFRCYQQAYQVFYERGWSLAEDHIQYTIGKQAVTLKKLDVASNALAHLLRPTSLQNTVQQAAFLREYIATQKELIKRNPDIGLLDISLPKVVQKSIRVLVTSHPPLANPHFVPATNINVNSNLKDEFKWQKLEEMVVQAASSKPIVFKPSRCLFTSENPTTDNPLCIHGEPVEISVTVANTIKPSITFSDINIVWEFNTDDGGVISNKILFEKECTEKEKEDISSAIIANAIQEIHLNEHEERTIHFKLTPKLIGKLKIIGIVGRTSATNEPGSLLGCLRFEAQLIKSTEKAYAADRSVQFDNKLNIEILPPAPSLHVSFSQVPTDVLIGEIIPVTLSLRNAGNAFIDSIFLGCDNPRYMTISNGGAELPLSILRDFKDLTNENLSKDKETRKQHVYKVKGDNESPLKPQGTISVPIWIQAPYSKGKFSLRVLIYYGTPAGYPKIRHRLVRHEWDFNVHDSLQVAANCIISNVVTNELAVEIDLKNLNQVHHPFMTEIALSSIHLYCPKYKLAPQKLIYINEMEVTSSAFGDKTMKSTKSMGLRCGLVESAAENASNPLQYITSRISSIETGSKPTPEKLPPPGRMYSFLLKNETKYLTPSTTNEEFNNIVSTVDPHMTMIITWKASISDPTSASRISFGQHFVQLRNLYEQVLCPETADYRIKTYLGDHQNYYKIYEYQGSLSNEIDDDDDQWEFNNNFVGKRCLLEDETFHGGKVVAEGSKAY